MQEPTISNQKTEEPPQARPNYKHILLRTMNKLRRQRDTYADITNRIRNKAVDPDTPDDVTDSLLDLAEHMDKVVTDLSYILDRSQEHCTDEDRDKINNGSH